LSQITNLSTIIDIQEDTMTIKLFSLLLIVVTLSACDPEIRRLSKQIEENTASIRNSSLMAAKRYASETSQFLEKNGKEKTITAAQESVRKKLKDPDSAKFQNTRITDYNGGRVVCGEVNAKNIYGGYVGYNVFVAGISGAYLLETSGDYQEINDAHNAGIIAACGRR
jgi:hypothetical protein